MIATKDTSAIKLLLQVVHLFSIPFIYVSLGKGLYSVWLSSFSVTVKQDIDVGTICL